MHERHSRRIGVESFLVKDFSDKTRSAFFLALKEMVNIIPPEGEGDVNASDKFGIGWVDYKCRRNQHGILVRDILIYINEAAFLLDGEDNRDLIPITVEHEVTEAWVDITHLYEKGRKPQSARTSFGHQAGRIAEYQLAHEMGVAERYLDLVKKWSLFDPPHWRRIFWQENLDAYEKTKPSPTR